ncbi:MAG TPA: chemotaxis protein CheW, partial [Cyanophyceae cyanobacterium]
MSNLLIHSQSGDGTISNVRAVTPSVKLIGFTFGELNLALRIESVYKVVNHTPVYSSGLNHIGVAHLGDYQVTVIDLHRRFFKDNLKSESHSDHYLVIVKNTTGEFYGIPVVETPVLLEVPTSMIR